MKTKVAATLKASKKQQWLAALVQFIVAGWQQPVLAAGVVSCHL